MFPSECVSKLSPRVYSPRRPRSSPLYRLFEEYFERLCVIYEERFEREYGPLRQVVRRAVRKYLECGILENGFARLVCGKCKAEFLVGFSCRVRMLCPSCHAKRFTIWNEWLGAELLERVPHRMITLKELITESVVENMLSWPHSGFHVHLGPVIDGNERDQLKMTARYGARAPLALSRLTYYREREEVSCSCTNPYDRCEYTEKVTPYELIARLVTHIPDPWEHTTRTYGWYSNRTRGVRRKRKLEGSVFPGGGIRHVGTTFEDRF